MLNEFYYIDNLVVITSNQCHVLFVVTNIRTYYRKNNKLRNILQ